MHPSFRDGEYTPKKLPFKPNLSAEQIAYNTKYPIHAAVKNNDVYTLQKALSVSSASINTQDNNEKTPLGIAVEQNNNNAVKLLLSAYADPNVRHMHVTPLHRAVEQGNPDITEQLIKKGADVDATSAVAKQSVLLWAVMSDEEHKVPIRNKLNIIGLLLNNKANPTLGDYRRTIIHHLAIYEPLNILEFMIQYIDLIDDFNALRQLDPPYYGYESMTQDTCLYTHIKLEILSRPDEFGKTPRDYLEESKSYRTEDTSEIEKVCSLLKQSTSKVIQQ